LDRHNFNIERGVYKQPQTPFKKSTTKVKNTINIFIYNKYLRPSLHCSSAVELENEMVI
jgi:hypothetical protein